MSSISKSITNYNDCKQACPKFANDFVIVLSNYTNKKIDLNPNITICGYIANLNLNQENKIEDGCVTIDDCTYQLQGSDKKYHVSIQLNNKNGRLHKEGGEPSVLIHKKQGSFQHILKYTEIRINGVRKHYQYCN
jgi:hypothetical protein